MPKIRTNWAYVNPGDIVSFNYKSESSNRQRMHTILVLNPRVRMKLKDGTISQKVIGLKLEQSNRRITKRGVAQKLFEAVGKLEIVDEESKIYRLKIDTVYTAPWPSGVKKNFYNKIKRIVSNNDIYRVYTWAKVPETVSLEPIVLK